MRVQLLLFLFAALCLCSTASSAKTLTIPGDADSIQEAVELAVSGDEIIVTTEEVHWAPTLFTDSPPGIEYAEPDGVVIREKNLTLAGGLAGKQSQILLAPHYLPSATSTMLRIIDSNVRIRNLYLDKPPLSREPPSEYINMGGPVGAPWSVTSGSLTVENCNLGCSFEITGHLIIRNSTLRGDSWMEGYFYNKRTISTPSLHLGPASHTACVIEDSTVTSNTNRSEVNVVMEDLQNCVFHWNRSVFIGGHKQADMYSNASGPGTPAVTINNCTDLEMRVDQCSFQGGNGIHAHYYTHGGYYLTPAGSGGSGWVIENSTLSFLSSKGSNWIMGGNGGNALALNPYDPSAGPDPSQQAPAEVGGNGMELHHSHIRLPGLSLEQFFHFQGGRGGLGANVFEIVLPPGSDGVPIYMDKNSTIETVATVSSWELH